MFEFARGGGPFSAMVVTLISVVIAIAVGFWLKRLLWAGGNPVAPQHYARIWAGWAVVAVCATQLTHLINFPSAESIARLLLGIVVFPLIGFAGGWLYGKLFKSNVTIASEQSNSLPSQSSQRAPLPASAVVNNVVSNSTVASTHPYPQSTPDMVHENAIYATVANELESGQTDKGLWTRLYVENDGDEKKTKLAYIKQRAEKIMASERTKFEERQKAFQIMTAESEELAASAGVTAEQAREMLKLGVTKVGDKFAFKEYRYDQLTDALNYAKKQVRT